MTRHLIIQALSLALVGLVGVSLSTPNPFDIPNIGAFVLVSSALAAVAFTNVRAWLLDKLNLHRSRAVPSGKSLDIPSLQWWSFAIVLILFASCMADPAITHRIYNDLSPLTGILLASVLVYVFMSLILIAKTYWARFRQ